VKIKIGEPGEVPGLKIEEATGVSVQHERDTDSFSIVFIVETTAVARVEMDVNTARMLQKALQPMKILEETER
jgi:hypothetical protein